MAVPGRLRCICGQGGLYWANSNCRVEEGLVGGSAPAVEVEVDDSTTTGNAVVQGLKERVAS